MPAEPPYILFYDGHCRFCSDSVSAIRQMDASADIQYVDVQNPSQLARFPQVDPGLALIQMHVITPAGDVAGGYDALLALMPALPSLRLFLPLLSVPSIREIGSRLYRFIARNRYLIAGKTTCESGACRIP